MPSPIGHLLAGLTVSLAADQRRQLTARSSRAWVACGLLAASPDLDLLLPGSHRAATHSLFAVGVVFLATGLITYVRAGRVSWRLTFACALAYATHVLTDYFGVDHNTPAGIQLLWPWSGQAFISDWSLFRATERYDPMSLFAITMNALALAQEILILGPLALLMWLRRRRLTRSSVVRRPPASRPAREIPRGVPETPDGQ